MVELDQMWFIIQQSLPCGPHTSSIGVAALRFPPGGGGGGGYFHMHIGYVPRERPPFLAVNFQSGAYM